MYTERILHKWWKVIQRNITSTGDISPKFLCGPTAIFFCQSHSSAVRRLQQRKNCRRTTEESRTKVIYRYTDDDHGCVYSEERSWKYPSHSPIYRQGQIENLYKQCSRYNHAYIRGLQSLILVSSSLPLIYGEVLLGLDCQSFGIFFSMIRTRIERIE